MVADGSTVKVHYTGTLNDGTQFDSSKDRAPLEFTLGNGQVIAGFEDAVKEMEVGDCKTITIPADKAYGQRREDLLVPVERKDLPQGLNPEVGQKLQMQKANGQMSVVTVTATSEESITIDANHPLAGEDLTFELELVECK
jgi:peptidylprolyl isomerase